MDDLDKLDAQLEQLEARELDVSLKRRRLHDRIAAFPGSGSDTSRELRERELSQERRELHRQIDELRARRNTLRSQRAEN
jgi:uncharacterized coiled-coil DUF342 family protein